MAETTKSKIAKIILSIPELDRTLKPDDSVDISGWEKVYEQFEKCFYEWFYQSKTSVAIGIKFNHLTVNDTINASFMRNMANKIGAPFAEIDINNLRDASELNGCHRSYIGSHIGAVTNALLEMNNMFGIIFINNFHVVENLKHTRPNREALFLGSEIVNICLHLIDVGQNTEHIDLYLGSDFELNLSNVCFVFCVNKDNPTNPMLEWRLRLIECDKKFNQDP